MNDNSEPDTTTDLGPVIVEIVGITPPARFPTLAQALAATWEGLKLLKLDIAHQIAFSDILNSPHSEQRMIEQFARSTDGRAPTALQAPGP